MALTDERRLTPVRLPRVRPPPSSCTPGEHARPARGTAPRRRAALRCSCFSASVSGRPSRRCRGWRCVPSALVSDASILHSAIAGSGTGPPHMPECSDCLSARTSTSTATRPRSAVVIDGSPVSKLPVSVSTMASACEELLVRRAGTRQVPGADLLLALDDDLHVERQRAGALQPGVDGAGVHHHAGLVVGGAAPVEAAVALGGLERAASSTPRRRRRAARRGARRAGASACPAPCSTSPYTYGWAPVDLEQLHVARSRALPRARRSPRRSRAPARIEAGERDARHAHQRFEIVEVGLLFFGESPEGEVNRHAGWIAPPRSGHHTVCKGSHPSDPAR